MKNRLFFFKMLLFVALMATWTSCSKSDDIEASDPKPVNPTPTNPTNPTDKTDPKDDPYMVVCKNVAEVAKDVTVYYNKSETLSDMEKYIDDIKKIENVEDAYASGSELFVKIKDYGKISYSFFSRQNTFKTRSTPFYKNRRIKKHAAPNLYSSYPYLGINKIAFASQVRNDESRQEEMGYLNATLENIDEFEEFEVEFVEPDVNFFKDKIYDYDFVLIQTHGGFDEKEVLHTFMTSERKDLDPNKKDLDPNTIYQYKNIPTNQVYFTYHTEIRNKEEVPFWYAMVTENWINTSTRKFGKEGKAIVFNTACQSMQGVGKMGVDSINYNVAGIFMRNGAGAYFGYDQSNSVGCVAAISLLCKLLSGMKLDNAYKDLPFDLLHEYKYDGNYWADLIVNYDPIYPDFKNSCLLSPLVVNPTVDTSTNDELKIKLNGKSIYCNTDYYQYWENGELKYNCKFFGPLTSKTSVRYGFYLSETQDIKKAIDISNVKAYVNGVNVSFESLLASPQIKPETTYYYWAYFYDGYDYYLSEMDSFKTGALKGSGSSDTNTSGQGNLPNVPGSDL